MFDKIRQKAAAAMASMRDALAELTARAEPIVEDVLMQLSGPFRSASYTKRGPGRVHQQGDGKRKGKGIPMNRISSRMATGPLSTYGESELRELVREAFDHDHGAWPAAFAYRERMPASAYPKGTRYDAVLRMYGWGVVASPNA
jgi:hypothetical protein